jgi:hypothetical protein
MTALLRLLPHITVSLIVLFVSQAATSQAQQPTVELYRVRVITKNGDRFRGTLEDIDSSFVYIGGFGGDMVPLGLIRKVVLRRNSKKRVQLVGIALGAIAGGYLANRGLEKNPTRSIVLHGVTVSFSAVGGAIVGLLVGSGIGNINTRVIRPAELNSSSLYRELKPFSERYQQEMIDHLNNSRNR